MFSDPPPPHTPSTGSLINKYLSPMIQDIYKQDAPNIILCSAVGDHYVIKNVIQKKRKP